MMQLLQVWLRSSNRWVKLGLASLLMVTTMSLIGATATAAPSLPAPRVFAVADCGYGKTFFGLPVWYKYLRPYQRTDAPDGCSFDFNHNDANPNNNTNEVASASAIVLIGLAVFEILLRIAGAVAVIFVIVGGYRYVLGQGEPDRIKSAQNTIINALIGLVLAIIASSVVGFVGTKLSGG